MLRGNLVTPGHTAAPEKLRLALDGELSALTRTAIRTAFSRFDRLFPHLSIGVHTRSDLLCHNVC